MVNYKNIIPFIKIREGGLSSAQTDTARKNSSPCGNGKNGFPYHTNKGVTWLTFSSNAKTLGYSASCSNFLSMPDEIWNKIYKLVYWDGMKCDDLKNQAIANTFVEWSWGSGVYGATNSLKKFFKEKYNKNFSNIDEIVSFSNNLNIEKKTPELFENLYDWRNNFFESLNQPANIKGWLNRLSAFYILNKPYATSKSTFVIGSVVALGVVGIIIVASKFYGKRSIS